MSNLIALTPKVKQAVEIINGIDDTKFHLLVSRIMQKLHENVNFLRRGNEIFSKDERVKLATTFSLLAEDVALILVTLVSLLEQITYHLVKPAILSQQLQQLGFSKEKLKDVNWRLNVQLAQGNSSQLCQPVAIFQLGITNSKQEAEKLTVEFNHEELFGFYSKLEAIQSQLDALK